jgi:hypothetical protein
VLLWQAATRDMNQTVPQSYIDQHMAEDAARASAEYGAQFRGDLERFVSREVVQAAVNVGVYERAYDHTLTYAGFVDPSGRSADSMTLAIAHFDYARQAVVLDCLREVRPPFSPEAVTEEFCQILASYQLKSVVVIAMPVCGRLRCFNASASFTNRPPVPKPNCTKHCCRC